MELMFLYSISLSDFGSWASIFSLFATGVLALFTKSIRGKVHRMVKFKDFKVDKESLLKDLVSTRELLKNGSNKENLQNISELTEILRRLEDYKLYMTKSDRTSLEKCRKIIQKGINENNISSLVHNVSNLIGFLKTRTEIDVNSL